MRVVQLAGWYFPESLGGTETYVAALAEHLRAAGHDVIVAAPEAGAVRERTYEFAGVPVFRYPIAAAPTRAEARHDVPVAGAERLHRWLADTAADVVHMHTFVTGVGPHEIRAAREAGSKVVVTTHSGALGFLCQRGTLMYRGRDVCDGRVEASRCAACVMVGRGVPEMAAALVSGIVGLPSFIDDNRRRQREMLAAVDAFVVLTEWGRELVLAETPGAPVVVNRLGVRTPPAAGARRSYGAPVKAAYVGRFEDIKGIFDLARAVRALPAGTPLQVEFRGPQRSAAEQAAVAELRGLLAGDPRVTVGDAIPPGQVYDYLSGIDVLCSPSLTLEGGPTIALEAMAVGVPVVSTRIGAMAEVLTDGVNTSFVAPGDWRALSQVLGRIAADPHGTLDCWRTKLPPIRTMADVTSDYLRLYQNDPNDPNDPTA